MTEEHLEPEENAEPRAAKPAGDEERSRVERELDRGTQELPPHRVTGFLGEKAPDMRKSEDFRPSVTGGLVQESTWETHWLLVVLLAALVLPSPVALYLVWRGRASVVVKWVATLLIAAWAGWVVYLVLVAQ